MKPEKHELGRSEYIGAFVSFLCFFLIMFAYYILRSTRGAIFLAALGKRWIPLFLVLNAVVSFFGATLFGKLTDILPRRFLITGIQGFFVSNMVCFWLILKLYPLDQATAVWSKLATACFTLWIGVFILFAVTPFWSLVNELFKPEQGKRLYGFICAGGTAGAWCGSRLVHSLARVVGTANLIPISAGILALTIPLFLVLIKLSPGDGDRRDRDLLKQSEGALAGLRIVLSRRYVAMIAAVVISSTFVQTIVDYQFHVSLYDEISSTDDRAAFSGQVFADMCLVSLLMQILVTPVIHSYFNVGVALAVLPLFAALGAVATLHDNGINTISWVYIGTYAALYSVNQASKEILYVPCANEVKYKAKAFIDAFGYRLGAACCGFLTLAGQALQVAGATYSFFIFIVAAAWIPLVANIQKRFSHAVGDMEPDCPD